MKKNMVSIVVPVYNAASFLEDTIQTVLRQTYPNWELLLVNDCSRDKSVSIIEKWVKKDTRIRLISQEVNKGAAESRNRGVVEAQGEYLTFLDADDLWEKEKLERQISFMKEKNCAFSFTGYEFATPDGMPNGKKVYIPSVLSYKKALKNTTIFTSAVMFHLTLIDKKYIYFPNVPSEDSACWWSILKRGYTAYGLNEILSYYRRSENTLSSNKMVAFHRIWNLYYNVEKLGFLKSSYCMLCWGFNAVKRRV